MLGAMALAGNASSIHAEGRAARGLVEDAREGVARALGVSRKDVVLTSGGTEAAALALTAAAGHHVLVGAGEHACVLNGALPGVTGRTVLPLDGAGALRLDALAQALEGLDGAKPFLALQAANNETGVIQPVAEAARLVHAAGGTVLCDAVQMCGRAALDRDALGADLLFISAHKFGGPKGAGALALRPDRVHLAAPLLRGGGQELGQRAGTENVAAISGMAAALGAACTDLAQEGARLAALRDDLAAHLRRAAPDLVIFGECAPRLPNTLCCAASGISAETLLIALDLAGVAVSSGSACSSGKVKPSHVLAAMGVPSQLAQGAVRLSLGWNTGAHDIARCGEIFADIVTRLRQRRAAA